MGNTLYLECAAGVSGDMLVAALLDAGASEQRLLSALESLPADGFEIKISRVKKSGLDCCDFDVILDDAHQSFDHDMEYLHGHSNSYEHAHTHEHDHGQEHTHAHEHGEGHAHEHRGLPEVFAIIDAANLTERANGLAHRIFEVLAQAEARAHGVVLDQVHFHEVGAIDSIADIVAIAVCVDDLEIERVIVTELCEGTGTVRCQHGVLPVPVPAVANIASRHGIALRILNVEGELVTPTGAAAVAALRTDDVLPPRFAIRSIGMGAGKRAYATSGILRAMLIESLDHAGSVDAVPKTVVVAG